MKRSDKEHQDERPEKSILSDREIIDVVPPYQRGVAWLCCIRTGKLTRLLTGSEWEPVNHEDGEQDLA